MYKGLMISLAFFVLQTQCMGKNNIATELTAEEEAALVAEMSPCQLASYHQQKPVYEASANWNAFQDDANKLRNKKGVSTQTQKQADDIAGQVGHEFLEAEGRYKHGLPKYSKFGEGSKKSTGSK